MISSNFSSSKIFVFSDISTTSLVYSKQSLRGTSSIEEMPSGGCLDHGLFRQINLLD